MLPFAPSPRFSMRRVLILQAVLGLLLLGTVHPRWSIAADQKYWELSPYRVQLHLSVDDSARPQPALGSGLSAEIQRQIRSTLYPLWSTEIKLHSGAEKQQLLTQLGRMENLPSEALDLNALASGRDKHIYLNVKSTPQGFYLLCREFDCTTRRWGSTQNREIRQAWMLSRQCFDLVCQTFSPLATVRSLPDDNENKDQEVLLRFRGSDLPRQTDLSFLMIPGEIYQPLMVRTNSSGEVKVDSIRDIPWTYLALSEQKEDGWRGAIHTGTRRPFGIRRRGRIEHLALAMRKPSGTTKVRFYARHDAEQGLTGYEVFRREPGATSSQPLGLTDTAGAVEISPGETNVTLLFLRSEGQLLAKVPVVPGAKPVLEVPVADDTARLRAQASLSSLTELLIDTVAQRNILIARARDRLKNNEVDAAYELYLALDDLPGRARFDQLISSAENRKLNRSDDPKVQARIEKLFADTRKLLGRFLSTRQISELQGELNAARKDNAS